MKVYLISHFGKPNAIKLESWVDTESVVEVGIHVRSVRAFIKRKYAVEWLKEKGWEHLEIKSAEIL